MERMYQEFREIAEFRMVYIREAHAADSDWSVPYAEEKNITEHETYEERCTTADMLIKDESLTIPTLIDDMEDSVNSAYQAWPDRIFVVRSDGILAVAAEPGPFGFEPALRETRRWLTALRDTGEEPQEAPPAPPEAAKPHRLSGDQLEKIVGTWELTITMGQRTASATLSIADADGVLAGTWRAFGSTSDLDAITFDGRRLAFEIAMGRRRTLDFEGEIDGDALTGAIGARSATVQGRRIEVPAKDQPGRTSGG